LQGDGDIWHFVDTPKNGKRSFTYDPATDLFTSEKYDAIPLSYNIDQIGAAKKNWRSPLTMVPTCDGRQKFSLFCGRRACPHFFRNWRGRQPISEIVNANMRRA